MDSHGSLKVVFISKSDATGGAAVVTTRIVEALRCIGVDAQIIVCQKCTDNTFVHYASSPLKIKRAFLLDRLKIFMANGFDRSKLFLTDAAEYGLSLWKNPLVQQADIICLEWFNQGMLSLNGLKKFTQLGKPIVWVMHDMWAFTGACHLPGKCTNYLEACGCCPQLNSVSKRDLSSKVFNRKRKLYPTLPLTMVAVSNYLKQRAIHSPLLENIPCEVIGNPLPPIMHASLTPNRDNSKCNIVMGAARLDDSGKGLPILIEALHHIANDKPYLAEKLNLVTYGTIKDRRWFNDLPVSHIHHGKLNNEQEIADVFSNAHIVVSPSHYESLPTTIVEGMARGCVPVAFDKGGQSDIFTHLREGFLVHFDNSFIKDPIKGGKYFAEGIIWAIENLSSDLRAHNHAHILSRFSSRNIARQYLTLFHNLLA